MVTYILGLTHSKLALRADMRILRTDYMNKENYAGFVRQIVNFSNGMILVLKVFRSILVWQPDIVHIQANSGYGFFEKSFLALMGRFLGRSTLVHVHGGGFRDFYYRSNRIVQELIRWCGEIPDCIVVASPQMLDTWRIIGLAEERIIWINNAVRLPENGIWDNPKDDKLIKDGIASTINVLFLTRIALEKGIIELIEAIALLAKSFPMIRLRIVGVESQESLEAKDRIRKLSLDEKIDYIGTVSEEQKQAEFLAADIYAFPTHVEDQSYAVLEAISYGLPCVASAVGGVPSIIESGVNGLLVPPKNVKDLADAIERLIRNPDLRRQLGIAGRKTVEERFTWDRPADEMYSLYEKITKERGLFPS